MLKLICFSDLRQKISEVAKLYSVLQFFWNVGEGASIVKYLLKYMSLTCIIFVVIIIFMNVGCSLREATKARVLFIGNSLTFANDLPNMVAKLAKSRNISMEYETYSPGGYKLSQHASDQLLIDKINLGNWGFVVLQEQSQLPAFSQEQVEVEVYPYAQRLCEIIREANPKTSIVFYMTMAKKNGDAQNANIFPEVGTYTGMQERINASYIKMAQQNHGMLAPVGVVWQNVREDRPTMDLYSDDTHPNIIGTYLAACVFYSALFKDSSRGLPHFNRIDDETALYLQRMSDQTLQSRSWNW